MLRGLALALIAGFALCSEARAANYPAQDGYIYDGAGMLSDQAERSLEQKLGDFERATTIGIAVATIDSLGGGDPDPYAIELGNRWNIGDGRTDNGVIIVIARQDRELSLWFGDGYESKWSYRTSDAIREQHMVPLLKQGDYVTAVNRGVDEIIRALTEAGYVDRWRSSGSTGTSVTANSGSNFAEVDSDGGSSQLGLKEYLLLGLLLLVGLFTRRGRSWSSSSGGSSFGGGGGGGGSSKW